MKIVFLEPIGELGGSERSLLDLMCALKAADPSMQQLLICASDGPMIEEAKTCGAEAIVLPMPGDMLRLGDSALKQNRSVVSHLIFIRQTVLAALQCRTYCAQLNRIVLSFQPDLIHSNGLKFHVLSRLAGFGKIPVLFHLRDFLRSRVLVSHAVRWASRRACHVISVSKAVAEDAQNTLSNSPISIVYDAIDTQEFCPRQDTTLNLDELSGLPPAEPETVRIGLVATYARWKGHHCFLESIARVSALPSSIPQRFYIVGGPIYHTQNSQVTEQELRQLARSLDIDDRVGFIGFRKDIADIYRNLDIVVHASTQPEPFGRTIVEAMACGKPVIVSAAGGSSELIVDNLNALCVSPGDVEGLARSIHCLVENPSERTQLGDQGLTTVAERFSRQRLALDMMNVYNRILGS